MDEDWEQQMLDMDNGGIVEIVPGMNVPKLDGDLGGEANQTPVLQPQLEESGTVPKKKGVGRPKRSVTKTDVFKENADPVEADQDTVDNEDHDIPNDALKQHILHLENQLTLQTVKLTKLQAENKILIKQI